MIVDALKEADLHAALRVIQSLQEEPEMTRNDYMSLLNVEMVLKGWISRALR